jgi:hypothetical protein
MTEVTSAMNLTSQATRMASGEFSEDMWAGDKIGYIEFSESVVSDNRDKRLHFPHPTWKNSGHQP